MARLIDDVVFALDMCVGPHPTDPFSLPRSGAPWYEAIAPKRLPASVVWSPTLGYAQVDDEIAQICAAAVEQLAATGTVVNPVETVWPEDPVMPWITMWVASRARTQGHLIGTPDFDDVTESLRAQVEWGMRLSAADMARSIDAVHEFNLQLETAFEQAPLLLTPVCAGHTPVIGEDGVVRDGVVNGEEVQGWVGFTYGFNMTRNPAGTVNVGFTSDGMPVGLQVVGRQRDDLAVLQALSALEELYGTDRMAEIG